MKVVQVLPAHRDPGYTAAICMIRSSHLFTKSLYGVVILSVAACGGAMAGDDGTAAAPAGGTTASGSGGTTLGAGGTTARGSGGTATGGIGNPTLTGTVGVACDLVDCAPLSASCKVVAPAAGACCPTCAACDVPCDTGTCPSGTHLEVLSGQCCAVCVSNCVTGQQTYAELRTQFVEKANSLGCKSHSDCTLLAESNRCELSCGIGVNASELGWISSSLDLASNSYCESCPNAKPMSCVGVMVGCYGGRCTTEVLDL